MHPLVFAMVGFVGLALVTTFLGWGLGLTFAFLDLARNHPRRMALVVNLLFGGGLYLHGILAGNMATLGLGSFLLFLAVAIWAVNQPDT